MAEREHIIEFCKIHLAILTDTQLKLLEKQILQNLLKYEDEEEND